MKKNTTMEEDREIVNKIRAGQTAEYRRLVVKYQNPVYRVILRITGDPDDAREIAQQVFVKAFESISQYDATYKFFSWIYRIAINSSLMFVKEKQKFTPLDEHLSQNITEEKTGTDDEIRDCLLNQSVNNLPEKYRSVVLLKYYSRLSYTEIAEANGISEKKVRSRLFDARKKLKDQLVKDNFFTMIEKTG